MAGTALQSVPAPTKSILVVKGANKSRTELFVDAFSLGFTVKTSQRYLGGFVGEMATKTGWMKQEISQLGFHWVAELAAVARNFPQTVCSGLKMNGLTSHPTSD